MPFDGFISYSHAADGRLAPAVQRGLHRLARPWHRRRALWIFRDQTGLAVTPKLWSSIQEALDGSNHFVLLASPEAARSPWVNREIEHWLATKSADQILPVVTDGDWFWDAGAGDFTAGSTAVPAALRGVFTEEPLFLDLRWARDDLHLSLQHVRFRDAIAQLAAPMHGVSKDELEGEDVRQHRRVRRLGVVAVSMLVLLTLVTSLTGMVAVRNADRANAAVVEADRQEQVATQQRTTAERATEESQRQQENARVQEARAQTAKEETGRQTLLAGEQQALAEEAAAEAEREQDAAERYRATAARQKANAERQQKLARGAGEEAQRQRAEADREKASAQRQQELADQASARATEQKKLAAKYHAQARKAEEERKRQEKLAREAADEARRQREAAAKQQRAEISRRLMVRARAMIVDDPKKALMLGVAAQRLNPEPQTLEQLSHLVMSTHYAGALTGVTTVVPVTGQVVATADTGGTVSLWDGTDPAEPVRLATVPAGATADTTLATAPDGHTLAVVNGGAEVALWNVTDPAHPARRAPITDAAGITTVTFSPDGHTAAASTRDKNTVLWDLTGTAPAPLATLPAAYPLQFGPDGRTAVTSGAVVRVWDLTDPAHPVPGAELAVAFGNPITDAAIAFSPKVPVVAVEQDGDYVGLWDLSEPATPHPGLSKLAATGDAHLSAMAFGPDGLTLALADSDGRTALWTIGDDDAFPWFSTQLATLNTADGAVGSLAFSADGRTLTTVGTARRTATLWSTKGRFAKEPVATLPWPLPGRVVGLEFGPDNRSLLAAGRQGPAVPWDLTDPAAPVQGATVPLLGSTVDGITLSPDGRTLAVTGVNKTVTLLDMTRPDAPALLSTLDDGGDLVYTVTFSPDSRTLAVGRRDGKTTLWDVTDREKPVSRTVLALRKTLTTIAFAPDGRTMAAGEGYNVSLWDVTNLAAPARLTSIPLKDWISFTANTLVFSPDGRTLAAGADDATVLLWDVADPAQPRQVAALTGHTNAVLWVAFTPDGRSLASASIDDTIMLWDIAEMSDPVPYATIKTPDLQSYNVALSRDGRTIAAGGTFGAPSKNVTLWDVRVPADLAADPAGNACLVSGRGLTADEWKSYVPELPHQSTC
ncbi:TIR domain-containing protein [Actinoplanes awajinensis]|uniref:TIR domain-containing protein n=1 Tax=Actinoplanes awajinensis subsp. mycoplanecinus TaxID=135947 RepID=A0A117ML10_9ACTN|nr:TIR domain-containing protein [Actinoplanes awajinensis]KUL22991.1 hypothetical protein ADL15_47140 [Actinoplanes awajinensis subsp. mycoplanecinus]